MAETIELRRVDGLWFPDANLVIQAEHTVFRVYGHFLGRHSSVFADMLALPPPPDAETYQGCALVRLPDSADDVCHFLKALMYYDYFEPSPAPTTFAIVAGVLGLSDKYEVASLRQRAIRHLSDVRPTTLEEWQGRNLNSALHASIESGGHFKLIALARQFSLDWLLPGAFYDLCDENADEEEILQNPLSTSDKCLFFAGRRVLEGAENSLMLEFLWTPLEGDGCPSPATCSTARNRLRRQAEAWRCDRHTPPNLPLLIWRDEYWTWTALSTLCPSCLLEMKRLHQNALEEFWQRLPSIFNLPEWDTLEAMKEEALKTSPTGNEMET
ncbi:hypothetical protein C8F01DRAFT_1145027 [Mycena amicta]|nr:hypothetical protein C8F01DRAFT_1145027 [Mycena amicta]